MKKFFVLFIFSTFALTGCDSIKAFLNKKAQQGAATQSEQPAVPTSPGAVDEIQKAQLDRFEAAPKNAIWPFAKDVRDCGGGVYAKVMHGECSGEWTIRTTTSPLACLYTWGPEVTCPKGTIGVTHKKACHGYIAKPFEGNDNDTIKTPADCIKRYGTTPAPTVYELQCCPDVAANN